jgi:arylsulfatase
MSEDANEVNSSVSRRNLLLAGTTLAAASAIGAGNSGQVTRAQTRPAAPGSKKPNIVVIWGDDIGISDLSTYSLGLMGFHTPHIDRIAREGMIFTDYYGEQSCTAGRSAFITGQSVFRTGMSKVGLPGASLGLQKEDPTIAELLKPWVMQPGNSAKIT